MKNTDFTNRWTEYKKTLTENSAKRVPRLEQCIEEFESQGYDISTMGRAEAKELGKIIGNKLSYVSAVSYCCVLNKFLKLFTKSLFL